MIDELYNNIDEGMMYDVFFQFNEDEPIEFAKVKSGNTFSLTLDASNIEEPCVIFSDGTENQFKLFMKKCF